MTERAAVLFYLRTLAAHIESEAPRHGIPAQYFPAIRGTLEQAAEGIKRGKHHELARDMGME